MVTVTAVTMYPTERNRNNFVNYIQNCNYQDNILYLSNIQAVMGQKVYR